MELNGKIALVTGGGSGVGAAVARQFAAAGAQVIIVGRREEPLKQSSAAATEGPAVQYKLADVVEREQIDALVAGVIAEHGRIDILVNNAGVNITARRLSELAPADWDYLMQVNATGAFNVVHAVLPHMRKQQDGVIISISSISGIRPSAVAGAAYSASKHALTALTKVIGLEEGDNGIRATLISPGEIDTHLLDIRPVQLSPEIRALVLQPDDVAAAALFVASLPARACIPELVIKPAKAHPFA